MACNAPLVAWKKRDRTALGVRAVTFRLSEGYSDLPVNVPCGKCAGCRMGKAREWAVRCTHEAAMWKENVFVTLTYDNEHVPKCGQLETLRKEDFVNFMKRLRKVKEGVRFLQAGEYGRLGRPHHHVLLFNCDFEDKTLWRTSAKYRVYRSRILEELWSKGHVEFGSVTFESAGYVAKYTLKKDSVALAGRVPEYLTMSRGGRKAGGIGKGWIDKFYSDVYPNDELVLAGGKVMKPPRYYDDQVVLVDPELMKVIKQRREDELSDEIKSGLRLVAREAILRSRLKDLKREL